MIKFGTGGWRAVIGSDFIESNIRLIARGLYELANQENKLKKPIVVGYDNRFLSDMAANWFCDELAKCGFHVLLLGESVPTPLVMHMVQNKHLFYGAAITASHNPLEYNGIKLFVEEGRDAPVEFTNQLEQIISNLHDSDAYAYPLELGRTDIVTYPHDEFIDHIVEVIDIESIRKKNLKILFDPMHGSGKYPLEVILHQARCHVDIINGKKDGFFGYQDPAPSPHTLKELMAKVTTGDYDLGIALDGDGDRLGIIDKSGRYISANQILVMLYWYLHEYKGWKGPVVRNLATTHMLDVLAEDLGERCIEVPVGFKYISAGIDQNDAVLGGESSGGLTVRGHIHGKDSIYAASLFVEMLANTGKTAIEIYSDLQNKYGRFEMIECNMKFNPSERTLYHNAIFKDFLLPGFVNKIVRVSYEDGCKIYFADNSWVICRFSGTEPVLRIFAEASTGGIAQSYIDCFVLFFDNLKNTSNNNLQINENNVPGCINSNNILDKNYINMDELRHTLSKCWVKMNELKPEDVMTPTNLMGEHYQFITVLAKDEQGHVGIRNRMITRKTGNPYFDKCVDVEEWYWSDGFWEPVFWMPIPR